jgi:hypothetical protein
MGSLEERNESPVLLYLDYGINLMNINLPPHQSDQSPDPLYSMVSKRVVRFDVILKLLVPAFSTLAQGIERIGAWVALKKEINPLLCCTMDYEISLMNINLPPHQSDQSPDPLYSMVSKRVVRFDVILKLLVPAFSTLAQGIERIGAWVALKKEMNPQFCCTMDYEISLMNINLPSHQSDQSPDPLY